jgi:hypothetical protein
LCHAPNFQEESSGEDKGKPGVCKQHQKALFVEWPFERVPRRFCTSYRKLLTLCHFRENARMCIPAHRAAVKHAEKQEADKAARALETGTGVPVAAACAVPAGCSGGSMATAAGPAKNAATGTAAEAAAEKRLSALEQLQ